SELRPHAARGRVVAPPDREPPARGPGPPRVQPLGLLECRLAHRAPLRERGVPRNLLAERRGFLPALGGAEAAGAQRGRLRSDLRGLRRSLGLRIDPPWSVAPSVPLASPLGPAGVPCVQPLVLGRRSPDRPGRPPRRPLDRSDNGVAAAAGPGAAPGE